MLQEDLVTILSNKAGHCKQGSVISIVLGTKAEDVIEVLMKIPEEARLAEQIKADTLAVSLHVRRGDYLKPKFWENAGCLCGVPYYRRAIAEIRRRTGEAHFYVFSDDPEWCRANLPLDETAVFVDWNKKADSWQDMMLMSLCRHNIICNSTFSWWGAWLNNNPGKTVLAPDRWFVSAPTPHINSPSWVTVPTDLPKKKA